MISAPAVAVCRLLSTAGFPFRTGYTACTTAQHLQMTYFSLQMGYGKRALSLLIQYYEGKIPSLSEEPVGSKDLEIEPTEIDEVNYLLDIL